MAKTTAARNQIQGWGADLHERPAVPKEANDESVTDMAGQDDRDKIPAQIPHVEILVSTEHKGLTPVFSSSCPPHGLSGMFKRLAFRFSEGQKAHWLILMLSDRIDVYENMLTDLVRGRPDNPVAEMGLKAEWKRGGFRSRFGHHRADTRRWGQQALLAAGIAMIAIPAIRKLARASSA